MENGEWKRDDSARKSADSQRRLRRLAEEKTTAAAPTNLEALTSQEIGQLVHELRVHQFELEMQNDELRQAHEALEALKAKYFDLYDLAPVGYITVSEQGLIQEANLTAASLLGLPRDSLCGQPLTRFILSADQDVYYLHRKRLLETRTSQVCEVRMLNDNRNQHWMRLEATLARDDVTGVTLCRTTLSDTTERRTLEATVAQADRLASVGLLAAGVAHEINNPLTYVLSNIESLADDIPRLAKSVGRCREALRERIGSQALADIVGHDGRITDSDALDDMIQRADSAIAGALRIKEIAKGLGYFSRVDETTRTMVDLNQAARHAIDLAAGETKYRAAVVTDFGPIPPIFASEGLLAQVFLNLIVNASHSIDEGAAESHRIKIRTWAEGDDVLAEVVDTGHGIPAENLDRIFDPFFTTKAPGRGTGLGLAISHRIVAEIGGDICVESTLGKGSRFVVRLPCDGSRPKAAPTDSPELPAVRGRILIVDDEKEVCAVLRRMLAAHETVAADSATEGQAILARDQEFDLILCDLMMPRVTGMDLHAWLAEKNPSLAQRMVFITGGVFTPRASDYLSRVGNLLLQKPFNVATLRRIVSELLGAAQAQGGLDAP